DGIIFHRDGNERYDGNKKHGPNLIPREIEPLVLEWREQDAEAGTQWVFHKQDGDRYGERVPDWTFRRIVEDAGMPPGFTVHHLKDLFVEWGRAAGLADNTLSA